MHSNDDLLVSNRNIRFILDFCAKHSIPESTLLSGLGYPESYMKDPDHWVSLATFNTITKRVRKVFNDDPSVFYEIGIAATQEGGLGVLESLKRVMIKIINDPGFLIRRIPSYTLFFNKTKDIKIIARGTGTATLQVTFRKGIDPIYDFNSGPLVMGVIASIPKIWKLPLGQVEELTLQYDVLRLLREEFSIFAEIKDGKLYIEGKEYGHEVELIKERVGTHFYYLGKHQEKKDGSKTLGILVTKEFKYRNYRLLVPGQIYNAPYFILKTTWQYASFGKRMHDLIRSFFVNNRGHLDELEEKAHYFQRYARELEEKVIERNKIILEEKQKIEELKNQVSGILGSQLPADLVEAMVEGKLVPSKQRGIVLFADLVGFSTKVAETSDFNDLLGKLNRYFEVANNTIKSREGWVYKYLGDGIMAVWGGYRKEEDYHHLGLNALEAAERMRSLVNETGWDIRIGIEYGEFLAGEIGPTGERIWDFLGGTVNYACRLEQNAEKNGILIGPNLAKLLEKDIVTEKKKITMKGIGEQEVHLLSKIGA